MVKLPLRFRNLRTLLTIALLGTVSTGHAAVNPGVTFLLFSDGTAGFDPAPGAGFDTGPNNRIVRTNDTFTYRVAFSTSGSEPGIVITETLPLGNVAPLVGKPVAKWVALPGYCTTGSSISADGQTITCALSTASGSSTTNVDLTATVLSSTPNGTTITAPTLTMISASGAAPAPTAPLTNTLPSQVPLPPKQAWCPSEIFCAGEVSSYSTVRRLSGC